MNHDPKADPYIALRRLVEALSKGRTLRERVRELRWRRVRVVELKVNDEQRTYNSRTS